MSTVDIRVVGPCEGLQCRAWAPPTGIESDRLIAPRPIDAGAGA